LTSETDRNTIEARHLGKCYHIYDRPVDRLKQSFWRSRKRFYREFWALRDLSFSMEKGESLGIIGRNGSGKSTLLQLICKTLTPTMGNVQVSGRVAALLELGSGFNPEFSGRENVYVNGVILGLTRREVDARFEEIADFADIGDFMDQPVKIYSSGMMVRLAFAVQTVVEPDLLVIDEALSVGDFFFAQKCAQRMRRLRDQGTTLLFVSHDMASVRDLCERAILLHKGDCLFQGPVKEAIVRYYQTGRSRVSETDGSTTKESEISVCPEDSGQIRWLEKHAIWVDPHFSEEKKTRIIAVDVRNTDGESTFDCILGQELVFHVLYQSFINELVHVTIILKNRLKQTIFSSGSYNHNVEPPKLAVGQKNIFRMKVGLMLEAGQYTVGVGISLVGKKSTHVEILDETPPLGPLKVIWDYETGRAPFFGMFGLPASAEFSTQIQGEALGKKP